MREGAEGVDGRAEHGHDGKGRHDHADEALYPTATRYSRFALHSIN
jgi:hypothetical protein